MLKAHSHFKHNFYLFTLYIFIMKVKFGSIVVDGRGKIGGHVASKNRGGSYFRTKVTPVNPRTASQFTVRGRFGTLSQSWKTLTQAQRDSWNAAVSAWSKSDIFSDVRNLTGLQLYQRLNNNLLSSGASQIATPAPNKGVLTVTAGVLTYTSGTPALSLARSGAVPAATRMKVFATPPLSAGISFVKSQLRLISTVAAATASPDNILAAYTAKFGAVGTVGTKIFVGIVFVDSTSGASSPMQLVSAISAT
jgi:hypothetical protein